ncbi:hypothetical protein V6N13_128397 [Hibiscus sabdariffa]
MAAGELHVVGTERHESQRIDNQAYIDSDAPKENWDLEKLIAKVQQQNILIFTDNCQLFMVQIKILLKKSLCYLSESDENLSDRGGKCLRRIPFVSRESSALCQKQ